MEERTRLGREGSARCPGSPFSGSPREGAISGAESAPAERRIGPVSTLLARREVAVHRELAPELAPGAAGPR